MRNLPDDYNMGWKKCHKHNIRYHLSDGACDLCIEDSYPKEGDRVDGYVWITFENSKMLASESCKKGYCMVQKGFAYGIFLDDNGRMNGGVRYNTKQEAYDNGKKLVVTIPK